MPARSTPDIRVVLLRLWRSYAEQHLALLFAAFGCMLVLGATTGAYAYLMGPALTFLLTGARDGLGRVGELIPWLASVDRVHALWVLPVAVVAIGVAKGFAYLGQFYLMGLFGQKVVMGLRRDLFARLAAISPVDLRRHLTGDLLSRFSADVTLVELAATYTMSSYLRDGLQVVILFAVALALDWRIALGTLVIVPVAVVPVSRLTRRFLRRTNEGRSRLGRLAGQIQEGLGGLKTIQAFNGQRAELARLEAHARSQEKVLVSAGWMRGAVPSLMEVLAAFAIASALSFATQSPLLAPDKLVSLLTAVVLMYQPAKDLGRVGQFALEAAVAGTRIFEVLDQPAPVPSPPKPRPFAGVVGAVRLEDVHFRYGERQALAGLTLEIPLGKVVALVGPSGGGKSTVTALLLRFIRADRGRYLMDGVDVDELSPAAVRSQFAIVTQEPLLFSDTVLENIRFARPNASLDEVVRAAKIASADSFIRALPRGYDTHIGERGVVLSGGQKQRLCLARAILANARILVLDEATSSLDPESEHEVQQAMANVLIGRTALVIAHRLSTVVSADVIHVVEAGRIVETGAHRELIARPGPYASLWALQSEPLRTAPAQVA